MDTESRGLQQGSSACWSTGAAAWGSSQQKRQRCEGSSSDQVGSSTSGSVQMSEPELLPDADYVDNEEEDYYMEDDDEDCDDENDDESEYEFDEADFNQQLADKFDDLDLPPGVEATVPWLQKSAAQEEEEPEITEDEITRKYKAFPQFYTVENFSDHHYADKSVGKPSRDWAKRIQHEWKLLEKDLPASIFVRVAEDRMDLLRAAIIGPKGTPYHDGLFFFDAHFTATYPSQPPLVYYHSGGLRLNPNLYNCGKVCLSLLGTWSGKGCETWNPAQSTMLQVLVSIQALILNEKPYFNEPGWAGQANTPSGEQHSIEYNKNTFLLSCRTMLYSLRKPPQYFPDLVAGHFREHGRTILAACKHYLEGNMVGSVVPEEEEGGNGASSSNSAPKQEPSRVDPLLRRTQFCDSLNKLFEDLLMEFNVKGADTRKFLEEKLKKNLPAA
ncbi:putative ubiquitin-conjugating enzyme E2 38 [Lolium rigidum]|uniref:putative ubiquitin-conjugating enzyme E2 38 n=1 Tax=Lolium rigidum TaxID=89674 RepID=UPI001F5C684D|nr:putative ubiquitin-conjugating enzyme E2 38 [Lolium rigidum]